MQSDSVLHPHDGRFGLRLFLLTLLLTAWLLPSPAFPDIDGEPIASQGDVLFLVDAVSFLGADSKTRESVSILLPNRELRFVRRDEGFEAHISASIAFRRWPTGELLSTHELEAKLPVASKDIAEGQHDLQVLQQSFEIEPGPYEIIVILKDRNTQGFGFFKLFARGTKQGTASGQFIAKRFEEGLSVSDVLLARDVNEETGEALANPNRLYGVLMPKLAVYYEIYSHAMRAEENRGYVVRHELLDPEGLAVAKHDDLLTVPAGITNFRRSHEFDISALPPGEFVARVTIREEGTGDSTMSESPFHVAWEAGDLANLSWAPKDRTAFLEELTIDEEFEALRIILLPENVRLLEKMTDDEKRSWMSVYWRDKDPTPETAINEVRREHYRRIHVANRRFKSIRGKGMESDRGRIYIRYGEPDQLSTGYSSQSFFTPQLGFQPGSDQQSVEGALGGFNADEKGYEIWIYNERGAFLGERRNRGAGLQLEFVFVDVEGYGNYSLIRSTDQTEF